MPNLALRDALDRRGFMAHMSAFGVAGTLLLGALWARIQEGGEITSEMLEDAEAMAGLSFSSSPSSASVPLPKCLGQSRARCIRETEHWDRSRFGLPSSIGRLSETPRRVA